MATQTVREDFFVCGGYHCLSQLKNSFLLTVYSSSSLMSLQHHASSKSPLHRRPLISNAYVKRDFKMSIKLWVQILVMATVWRQHLHKTVNYCSNQYTVELYGMFTHFSSKKWKEYFCRPWNSVEQFCASLWQHHTTFKNVPRANYMLASCNCLCK